MKYRIGTRGSKLALAQAEGVRKRLEEAYPEDSFELVVIQTSGDKIKNRSLRSMQTKGVFVKEIEEQLLNGTIDLAVHSLKDMPTEQPDGLTFCQAWKREDPRDALILREVSCLENLPPHAIIGTGSARRASQLLALRPDLRIVDIRGNIDTRLRKMEEQGLDGIVLAVAGLRRLGLEGRITQILGEEEMLPAPAQGMLGIELRADAPQQMAMLNALSDPDTAFAAEAERGFLMAMGGGCHIPLGAWCQVQPSGQAVLRCVYQDERNGRLVRTEVWGANPSAMAEQAAAQMLERCAENTVWVTKIGEEVSALTKGLRERGISAEEIQVGEIVSRDFTPDEVSLTETDWIVFTSLNGLRGFFEGLNRTETMPSPSLNCRFAVIGVQTAAHLGDYGFVADFVPTKADSDHFWREFAVVVRPKENILYCTGRGNHLPEQQKELEQKGIEIKELAVYENREVPQTAERSLSPHATVFFTCASSVYRFLSAQPKAWTEQWKQSGRAVSIGTKTTMALRKMQVKRIEEAAIPSYTVMIERYLETKNEEESE